MASSWLWVTPLFPWLLRLKVQESFLPPPFHPAFPPNHQQILLALPPKCVSIPLPYGYHPNLEPPSSLTEVAFLPGLLLAHSPHRSQSERFKACIRGCHARA